MPPGLPMDNGLLFDGGRSSPLATEMPEFTASTVIVFESFRKPSASTVSERS